MGMWLLRSLSLRFKGKLIRFVVILVVVCVVLNFFLFKRGTQSARDRTKHLSAILNKIAEKPFENELETSLNFQQRVRRDGKKKHSRLGKKWKNSSRKKSQGTEAATSEFDTSIISETKLQDYTKQENQLITQSTEYDIKAKPELLVNKDDKEISRGGEEDVMKEAKFISDPVKPELSPYFCPQKFISRLGDIRYGKCKPHRPNSESCFYAEQLYFLDKNLTKCKINSETVEICNVTVDKTHQELGISSIHVKCDRLLCWEKWYSTSLAVWTLDGRSGEISRVQSFSSTLNMEKELPRILIETIKKLVNFVVLKCSRRKDDESVSQLIPINPWLTVKRSRESKKSPTKIPINVNILLLDSVSRAHFYRSLPKTIDMFKNWSSSKLAPAKVFDFELFQAIQGHTAENTHALFTGKTLPPHLEDEFPPVEMGVAFGRFVKAGYQTLWQEDLCWKGGWGLMTDMSVVAWEDLDSKLKENFIDSIGITHSSCEVLNALKLETPFNGPEDNQICYNGKFQHDYLLKYTLDTIDAIKDVRTAWPLLSYMSLSVGHDNNGRRIQTLDQSLAEYVDRLGKDDNTLTFILADHGNTYTEYTVSTLEGRFEMYHPSLFMIVPRNVSKRLGSEAMRALRTNQRRLVNMYDLHHTLMALAGPLDKGRVSPQGVFTSISANRTCNDIKLLTPNLCVCEGWDSPTTNDTLKISLVEFAVGEMNELIDKKFIKGSKEKKNQFPLLKSCRRLIPVQFENVRERIDKKGRLRTTMDIHVKPLEESPGKKETFHVEIESKETPDSTSMDLKLVHFDRMSVFEKYKKCSDVGVSPLLCICSNTAETHVVDNNKRKIDVSVMNYRLDSFQAQATVDFVDEQECLLLVKRHHSKQSFSTELANLCLDFDISVFVKVDELDNMKFSRNLPAEFKIPAGSMQLVFTARKDLDYWPSNFDIKIRVTEIRNRSHGRSQN